jgi:hypothetical protein
MRLRNYLGARGTAARRCLEFVTGWEKDCKTSAAQSSRKTQVMPRISFHRLAEHELIDAALYYERESTGLGGRFLDEIERHIDAIAKNPNAVRKSAAKFGGEFFKGFPTETLWVGVVPESSGHHRDDHTVVD